MKKILLLSLFFVSLALGANPPKLSLATDALLTQHQQAQRARAANLSTTATKSEPIPNSVTVFVTVDETFDAQLLEEIEATIGLQTEKLLTVHLPLENVGTLSELQGVVFVDVGGRARTTLSGAVPAMGADKVHAGTNLPLPYTGKGVVVGIVDYGIDLTHPMFYNSEGLKVRRVWIQGTGSRSNNYPGYGKEYRTQEALLALQTSNDTNSHGTHVAGIAAGSGSSEGYYIGVAPDAELVFVELGAGYSAEIIDGIKYVFDYAQSVGKPAVVNLSLGMHWGPHNGTSDFDIALDTLVGEGRVVVGSAGNEGHIPLHAKHSFSGKETVRIAAEPNKDKKGVFCAVFSPPVNYEWAIEFWNKSTRKKEHVTGTFSSAKNDHLRSYSFPISGKNLTVSAESYDTKNKMPSFFEASFTNPDPDKWAVTFMFTASSGTLHAWNAEMENLVQVATDNSWMTLDGEYSVGEIGGTAREIITVGAYSEKVAFISMNDGKQYGLAEKIGEVASFSSRGPTADGRTKPDVVAPGCLIFSSVNSFNYKDYYIGDRDVVDAESDNVHLYAVMSGTSMASPMVAGAVALLLEADPTLTPDTIKGLLRKYAVMDEAMRKADANTRGFGKVNVYDAVLNIGDRDLPLLVAQQKGAAMSFAIVPNPNAGNFYLQFNGAQQGKILLYNLAGTPVYSRDVAPQQTIRLQNLPSGIYIVKLQQGNKQTTQKMVIVR